MKLSDPVCFEDVMRGRCAKILLLFGATFSMTYTAIAVPVFLPQDGATFHKSPSGPQVPVPYGVLLAPIEGKTYNGPVWCKWRLVTGRGALVKPSTAWLKCSMTGKSVGHM